ncbi:MAG: T9SS type A sorting domain-containing protein, partial [Bacteroidales bacterium]
GNNVGHAMTFVGYNDSVRVDLNNDGLYTNNLDINDDGVVDMRDWEVGALLAVNSWGNGWGKSGKAYVLYSVVARQGNRGGIWNRSVHLPKVLREYTPQLTMRVVMRHESREKFRILAGCSNDPSATKPEHWLNVPLFRFQGGDRPLQDLENQSDPGRFEFGLDLSPLLTHIEPGEPVRFFLVVEEQDPFGEASGRVDEISVIHYGDEVTEIVGDQRDISIQNNSFTYISLVRTIEFDPVTIDPPQGNDFRAGEPFSIQLTASGGQAPYRWELVKDYTQEPFVRQYEPISGDTLSEWDREIRFTPIELPFDFPFYGEKFRTVVADIKGSIHFDNEYGGYPYVVDKDLVFRSGKSIVPFGADIEVNIESDCLVVQVTDSVAIFQWNASVYTGLKVYPVKVMACLYPDGLIEFLYGARARPPQGDYPWISGISNGDNRLYKYSQVNDTRLTFEHYGIRFRPLDYPAGLTLTDDGLLSGIAQQDDHIWSIQVKATDRLSQAAFGAVSITTVDWELTGTLGQNYPNPFTRITSIGIRLGAETDVTLEIYDLQGRKVKELANRSLPAGEHLFYWNARDEQNRNVLPGLYLYRLRTPKGVESGKMMLVR